MFVITAATIITASRTALFLC